MGVNLLLHDEVRLRVERAIAEIGSVNVPVLAASLHSAFPLENRLDIERLVLGFAEINSAAILFDSHDGLEHPADIALIIEFICEDPENLELPQSQVALAR